MLLLLFVFAICFSSFAIPTRDRWESRDGPLKFLFIKKIRISSDWGQALGLALLQMFAVLVLSFFLKSERTTVSNFRKVSTPLLSWAPGLVLAIAPRGLADRWFNKRCHQWLPRINAAFSRL